VTAPNERSADSRQTPATADPWPSPGIVALAALIFLFAVVAAVLRVTSLGHGFGMRLGASSWVLVDFKSAIWLPARALLDGIDPYDAATYLPRYSPPSAFPPYLPFWLVMHLTLGEMPLSAAGPLYFLATIVLTAVGAWLALYIVGIRRGPAPVLLVAAAMLLSRPGQWNLLLGQGTMQSVLACWVALGWATREPTVSGVGLAIAALKPSFGFPLGALMLARRDWSAVRRGILFGVLLNILPAAYLAWREGGVANLAHTIVSGAGAWSGTEKDVDPVTSIYRTDAIALVSRMTGQHPTAALQVVIGLLVLALGAWGAIRARRLAPHGELASASIICLAVLLCMHHQAYDQLLLTLPVVALVWKVLPPAWLATGWRLLLLAGFAVVALNYGASEAVMNRLAPSHALWLALASPNGAVLAAIFACYIWLASRRELAAPSP